MGYKGRILGNWAVVVLGALIFGGLMAWGIIEGQMGETLFNATLV